MEISLEGSEWGGLFDRISSTDDLQQCVIDVSKSLQIDYIAFQVVDCCVILRGAPYFKTNFPAEWVRRYLVKGYARIDPAPAYCNSHAEPCLWSNLRWNDPKLTPFLQDALDIGLPKCGYIIPLNAHRGLRAMMNVSSHCGADEWPEKIKELSPVLDRCAQLMHAKAVADLNDDNPDVPSLTQREIECLSWVAQGKDARSIAIILELSEHTVRDYCKSARHKLGCSTLYQAIYRATLQGILYDKAPS